MITLIYVLLVSAVVVLLVSGIVVLLVPENDIKQKTIDEGKKEMVELLGRIYNDSVCHNGKIQWDTRQLLNDWVNK